MAARLTARLPEDRSVCQNHRASKHHEIEHVWAFVGRIISLYTRPVSTWSPWKSRNTDHSSQHLNEPPQSSTDQIHVGFLPKALKQYIYIHIYHGPCYTIWARFKKQSSKSGFGAIYIDIMCIYITYICIYAWRSLYTELYNCIYIYRFCRIYIYIHIHGYLPHPTDRERERDTINT